ncbi:MAG: high frequency lysogenization protein HflD [Halofilum sp. (in: g-proteobacteria)]|nr:high frequency lysogenization protein HflD [Halofilum sp. (in: g-proteobacteria)]
MHRSPRNQALALAGLLHCTALVRQLAHQGRIAEAELACALRPLFQLEPDSVDAVYADAGCRHSALTVLKTQLGGSGSGRDMETTRYAATLMHLERKLARRDDLVAALRAGLEESARQLEHFPVTHDNIVARLADLYGRTVSTLRPRVMVQGEARFLEEPDTANRVRALLLAGMRSAVLWRQCGGSRLRLVLGRGRLMDAAAELDAA